MNPRRFISRHHRRRRRRSSRLGLTHRRIASTVRRRERDRERKIIIIKSIGRCFYWVFFYRECALDWSRNGPPFHPHRERETKHVGRQSKERWWGKKRDDQSKIARVGHFMVNRPLATSISGSHQLASDSADKERPQYFFKKKPPHLRGGFIAGTSSSASETTRLMAAQFFQNDVIHDQRGSRMAAHVFTWLHSIISFKIITSLWTNQCFE